MLRSLQLDLDGYSLFIEGCRGLYIYPEFGRQATVLDEVLELWAGADLGFQEERGGAAKSESRKGIW